MRTSFRALLLSLLVSAGPVVLIAAGGSAPPQTNPEDEAAAAYERGLAHRDRAWELEAESEAATDAAKKAKLDSKAQKEYEKAIRAFRAAIESNPELHQAHGSLGYALRKTGRFDESLAAYNRALELQPGYTEAIEYRAEAYLGLNRLDEAKEAYMQLFREDRERADELMTAMEEWVEARQADAGSVEPTVVEAFAGWVEERRKISGNTARLEAKSDETW